MSSICKILFTCVSMYFAFTFGFLRQTAIAQICWSWDPVWNLSDWHLEYVSSYGLKPALVAPHPDKYLMRSLGFGFHLVGCLASPVGVTDCQWMFTITPQEETSNENSQEKKKKQSKDGSVSQPAGRQWGANKRLCRVHTHGYAAVLWRNHIYI